MISITCGLLWYVLTQVELGAELNMTDGFANLASTIFDAHLHTGLIVWYFLGLGNGYMMFVAYLLGLGICYRFVKPDGKLIKWETKEQKRAHLVDVLSTIPLGLALTSMMCVVVCVGVSKLPWNASLAVTQE
jgi:hypothetical protein